MDIYKALSRIKWRFQQGKEFKPNENDIMAFNEILKYYSETQKQQFEENELFAKLYLYLFQKIIENDKTTVFDNNARNKIANILKKPLSQIIEELKDSLNYSERYCFFEDVGVDLKKHPLLSTRAEKEKELDKIINQITAEGLRRIKGDVWDYETVKEAVLSEVNQMINLYGRRS